MPLSTDESEAERMGKVRETLVRAVRKATNRCQRRKDKTRVNDQKYRRVRAELLLHLSKFLYHEKKLACLEQRIPRH